MGYDNTLREIVDRLRRLETRLTKYMISQGFDSQTQTPVWLDDGYLEVPSLHVELSDIVKSVPDSWNEEVVITHKGNPIISFLKES
jgi:hypothetical protein